MATRQDNMESHHNAILLILNCKKYEHKRHKQVGSWLAELPSWLPYYHIIGLPLMTTKYSFDHDAHILYVQTADDYNSLPQKTLYALLACYETFSFNYIFKTDDDQMFEGNVAKYFDTLYNCLTTSTTKYHYGGHILKIPTHYSTYYRIHSSLPQNLLLHAGSYCNGRFYLLSHEAIEHCLVPQIDDFVQTCKTVLRQHKTMQSNNAEYFIEDYAIGHLLDMVYKTPMLKIDSSKLFKDMV